MMTYRLRYSNTVLMVIRNHLPVECRAVRKYFKFFTHSVAQVRFKTNPFESPEQGLGYRLSFL